MKKLTLFEKYSRHWPLITVSSTALAIFLFGAYLYSSDVLIEGYLRFAAFCFFALALLSLFKVKDGQVQIDFRFFDDGGLEIDYLVRDKNIASEAFDLNRFEDVEVNDMPNRTIYNDFARNDRAVRFREKESKTWLYLTEVHGRVIPLNHENASKLIDFLRQHMH